VVSLKGGSIEVHVPGLRRVEKGLGNQKTRKIGLIFRADNLLSSREDNNLPSRIN
jgi:hypothetical protein